MGNIATATVTIRGTRPLWWCHLSPAAFGDPKGGRKEKEGSAGNDPTEWKRSYLANSDGQMYILPSYVFGCIRDAAKYTKKGRGSIQSAVAATLQVKDKQVLIDRYLFNPALPPPEDPDLPVYLDIRTVKNPATKGRNVRYRVAASPGWTATFTLEWDKTIVSRREMEAVLTDAGPLVGLADGRSIGMGRFEVVSFDAAE